MKLRDDGLIRLAEITSTEVAENAAAIKRGAGVALSEIKSAIWFLPPVEHALKGGVRTVFMAAQELSHRWGTLNLLVIYSHSGADIDLRPLEASLSEHFPHLRFILRCFRFGIDRPGDLPFAQVGVCTLWTTAYLLMRYNQVHRKFYFMQDYEPLFYEAGSIYACIEQTYRLGFSCIANTPSVGDRYRIYSNDVVAFVPGIDDAIFHSESRRWRDDGICRIVFYGRPGNPRNCFTLGVRTLRALKRKMGAKVEIVSAGAEWDEREYGVEGVVKNLGLLKRLEDVSELYRSSDVGLVYMVTPHPSYQPLEYMACGCLVATNVNEANRWLLRVDNSIQLPPNPELAAQYILDVWEDRALCQRIRDEAYKTVKAARWEEAMNLIADRLVAPSSAATVHV